MFEGKTINVLPMTPKGIVNNDKAKEKDNSEGSNTETQENSVQLT